MTDPWDHIDLSGTLAEASRRVLAEVERRKIEQALRQAGGDPTKTSETLQIPHKTLLAKMRDLGIGSPGR